MTIKELAEECSKRTSNNRYPCSGCPFIRECKKCRSELPFILTHQITTVLEKQSLKLSNKEV